MVNRSAAQCATESVEQQFLFRWAAINVNVYPEIALLFHIPNGGKRDAREAARMKTEGVRAGIPDLCLPVARGVYHALYIELKRSRGGKLSEYQKEWLAKLNEQGNLAVCCDGWTQAAEMLLNYLRLKDGGKL